MTNNTGIAFISTLKVPLPPYHQRPLADPGVPSPSFPWLTYVPLELRHQLSWSRMDNEVPPIILLYSGPSDETSLGSHLRRAGILDYLEVDILGTPKRDILDDSIYNSLCTAASEGRISAVVGGPNCRTFSVRRLIPKPGGGVVVRSRTGQGCSGQCSPTTANVHMAPCGLKEHDKSVRTAGTPCGPIMGH